jgi:hypothetical protein
MPRTGSGRARLIGEPLVAQHAVSVAAGVPKGKGIGRVPPGQSADVPSWFGKDRPGSVAARDSRWLLMIENAVQFAEVPAPHC